MSCCTGIDNGDKNNPPVMSYEAFIYLLLRTAADDDGTFREAFAQNPSEVLGRAGHEINLSEIQNPDALSLPAPAEAQSMLRDYLTDFDGSRLAGQWVMDVSTPYSSLDLS